LIDFGLRESKVVVVIVVRSEGGTGAARVFSFLSDYLWMEK
jgi:hypothetical protein